MQDLAAECLEMERGVSGSLARLEAVEFKIKKKRRFENFGRTLSRNATRNGI